MTKEGISPEDYAAFCTFLRDTCGIVLGETKHYLVSSRLRRLMEEYKTQSVGHLLEMLRKGVNRELRERVVDAMTTNETYWFRDQQPYSMLKELVLPNLDEKKLNRLRIWSTACSYGQEPYSISMVGEDFLSSPMRSIKEIQIVATDISPTVLKQAKSATYDKLSMGRGLNDDQIRKYFDQKGSDWQVKQRIRDRIRFMELNLVNSFASLGKFNVIFCRNVLIYFSPETKRDILGRVADALEPGGYLFLGGSESMATYSDRFETVRFQNGLAYQVKG